MIGETGKIQPLFALHFYTQVFNFPAGIKFISLIGCCPASEIIRIKRHGRMGMRTAEITIFSGLGGEGWSFAESVVPVESGSYFFTAPLLHEINPTKKAINKNIRNFMFFDFVL